MHIVIPNDQLPLTLWGSFVHTAKLVLAVLSATPVFAFVQYKLATICNALLAALPEFQFAAVQDSLL